MTGTNGAVLHAALILDASGSMEASKHETIGGYNQQVEQVREAALEGNVRVWLTVFNDHVKAVHQNEPVQSLRELTEADYQPDGYTALYDAVGLTLTALESVGSESDNYLVMIVSDGMENASREWSAEQIAEKVKALQGRGNWTFVYIGANQDLAEITKHLGIPQGNAMRFEATADGTELMFQTSTASLRRHLRAAHESDRAFSSVDFFSQERNEDDA